MKENYIKYIAEKLSERDLLEQLAEEASELSQAALKLIRASRINANYTNLTIGEAKSNLIEEFYDVFNVWLVLVTKDVAMRHGADEYLADGFGNKKQKRWAERLGYKE